MENPVIRGNSPGVSLVILIGLMLLCTFVCQIVVVLGYFVMAEQTGVRMDSMLTGLTNGSSPHFTYLLMGVSSVATFLIPSIWLQRMEQKTTTYLPLQPPLQKRYFVLAVLFLLAFNPILGLISEWNTQMTLPESWSGIESWMRLKEDEMATLTQNMVMTDSVSQLLLNIVVIAVLPAVSEEFFFRGALQGIFGRWITNVHVVIWLTAIVFSAIHVQFFGFIPRVLLGALFGYMLYASGSLWVPVLAHFVNNASVVLMAFYYTRQGKTYADLMTQDTYHFGLYFASLVVSVAVGWYIYRLSLKDKALYGTGLG